MELTETPLGRVPLLSVQVMDPVADAFCSVGTGWTSEASTPFRIDRSDIVDRTSGPRMVTRKEADRVRLSKSSAIVTVTVSSE